MNKKLLFTQPRVYTSVESEVRKCMAMNECIVLGEKIREKRLERGWTQPELAERMGYNKSTILRIERGEHDLTQSRIKEFANVLGTTPGYLMGWEVDPRDAGATAAKVLKNPEVYQFVLNYFACDEADQYTLRLMADSLAAKQKKD